MTCKDCDRQIVCRYYTQWANVEQVETDRCQYFKNKADVVPVVRCKECKHWNYGDCYRIELSRPDDYCSYGGKEG